ncbi:MAG: hypothetical protein M3P18_06420, partial [Actinomycetota bacterium]|nr:hypothetical protein [Actinomycetota bacterium]
ARNKHAGRLTYVPILTMHRYLGTFWFPRRAESLSNAIGERLVSRMQKLQKTNRPDFTTSLSPERALQWVSQRGPELVADALAIAEEQDRQGFLELAACYVSLASSVTAPFRLQWATLCIAHCLAGRARSHADANARLVSDVESLLRSLPGDALFLNCLGPEYTSGYVCYLRVLRDIGDPDIAVRPRERAAGAPAERIGHLRSPYVYRLTQQLAEVFSSIGLPDEYEQSRDDRARSLAEFAPNQKTSVERTR